MKTKNKTLIFLLLSILLGLYFYKALPSVIGWGPGNNYRNVSVRTTVNVTESMPEILNISCNGGSPVTLNAGTTKQVICIIQLRDFNGGNTIDGTNGSFVNGTFYYYLNSSTDPDDNNVHYTNASCGLNGSANGFYVNWTCSFDVWYYANNGSWRMNATVLDTHYYVSNPVSGRNYSVNSYGNTTISPLYALNVTPLIDYGELAVGDTSATPVQANVTNLGNMNINVSVYGYGNDTDTAAMRLLAMVCEYRNITISNERYSINPLDTYGTMTPLTGVSAPPAIIQGLKIQQQQDDLVQVVNSTYWMLHVNITTNPFGQCNGTVIFNAQSS